MIAPNLTIEMVIQQTDRIEDKHNLTECLLLAKVLLILILSLNFIQVFYIDIAQCNDNYKEYICH